MKNLLAKIWVPTLLVLLTAAQTFGIDIHRTAYSGRLPGSIFPADSLADTLSVIDTSAVTDTLPPAARDTIIIPDSLRYTDPFFHKYYIAVKDSTTRKSVRDSLTLAGDTLELHRFDSLYVKDSTETAIARHNAWYASLSRKERKKYDAKQALPGLIAAMNRKLEIKDSIRKAKDSIIAEKPRILETFALPDSMQYKRIITWTHERHFHNLDISIPDTTYNTHFHEYPFFNTDVNATYLGVIGSPEQSFDFFNRKEADNAIFYTPYLAYNYTPATLPQYNTKTPHTELAYWGTLFANKEKEESDLKILTTQNILPELNLTLEYRRFGGNGMLKREDTDNRSLVVATNYIGKKYMMHAGYIFNRIEKSENGGIVDNFWIRDTTVDAREIDVYLSKASNKVRKNTVFLDQTYRIPFSFINRLKERKELKREETVRDSIMASGDSLEIERLLAKESQMSEEGMGSGSAESPDTARLDTDITTAFIGHSTEYTVFTKMYQDEIQMSDKNGRDFYNDRFYLNPTKSADSLRVMKLENRVFLRLQPWASDAILSKVDVGIGDKLASYYNFKPSDYLTGPENILQNSAYLYAGANGQFKKYLNWNAKGQYTFLGHELNDFVIDANIAFSIYPFRRQKTSPLTFKAHFETSLKEPDFYQQHLYTNHFRWDNDFSKISTTKINASVDIPAWELNASFGYALLGNNIYYDTEGIVRQNTTPMSVMTAKLRKDFSLWKFRLENRALFQLSSNEDVIPLPMLALNLRYYLQFDVVKKVMQMQIGANAMFTTKWYAPGYNPVLGVFHNQNIEKFGNCPYIDAFVNIQWKRACIFVKVVNVNMGWPNKSADYFSAAGYIAPQRAIKFGISWPFYIQPGRSVNSAAGSSRGGAGMPEGLSRGSSASRTRR